MYTLLIEHTPTFKTSDGLEYFEFVKPPIYYSPYGGIIAWDFPIKCKFVQPVSPFAVVARIVPVSSLQNVHQLRPVLKYARVFRIPLDLPYVRHVEYFRIENIVIHDRADDNLRSLAEEFGVPIIESVQHAPVVIGHISANISNGTEFMSLWYDKVIYVSNDSKILHPKDDKEFITNRLSSLIESFS